MANNLISTFQIKTAKSHPVRINHGAEPCLSSAADQAHLPLDFLD